MQRAAVLAAAKAAQGGAVAAPLTQNRRETLAEQGIATPGPMTQNQIETLAEQGVQAAWATAPLPPDPAPIQRFPRRLLVLMRPPRTAVSICFLPRIKLFWYEAAGGSASSYIRRCAGR